jgi:hypothetical protein
MSNGFPAPITAQIPADGVIPVTGNSALTRQGYDVIPLDLKEGKIYSWNAAIQRQLPFNFALELAYVANRTHGAIKRLDLNAGLVPGADNAGRPLFAPFGRTATALTWFPTNSQYDSLQVKLDRRFSNGLLWTNSYTLGRAKDYGSDGGALSTIGTPANIALTYGLSDFDRTHSFVSSFVYELPFMKDAKGAAAAILGGWQVAGVFVAQSGTPVDITTSNATLKAPGNTQRPNLTGSQRVIGDIGAGKQYFDPAAYSVPAAATFGNMSRNTGPRGPHYINMDASLVKRVHVNERVMAELRVDAFNVTNTPHFNNPNGALGNPTFGQITSSFGERFLRFGAKVTF